MHDPKHPIWPLLRVAVTLLALTVILYLGAEHFDISEIRTIIAMLIGSLGIEGATALLTKNTTHGNENS